MLALLCSGKRLLTLGRDECEFSLLALLCSGEDYLPKCLPYFACLTLLWGGLLAKMLALLLCSGEDYLLCSGERRVRICSGEKRIVLLLWGKTH